MNINPIAKTVENILVPSFIRKSALKLKEPLQSDKFESERIVTIKNPKGTVQKGEIAKRITLADRKNGGEVNGFIMRDLEYKSSHSSQYFVGANGNNQCRMIIEPLEDELYIDQLYGHHNVGEVKGAGTEMLKFAVEKSREMGFDGRLSLHIGGSPAFYYKNNFRMASKSSTENAILDYVTKNPDVSFDDVWNPSRVLRARLDEKGAKALEEGRRLYTENKSQTLYSKEIEVGKKGRTLNVDMHFFEEDDKFAILMINPKARRAGFIGSIEGKIENGRLVADEIDTDRWLYEGESIVNEFNNALNKAQEIYNNE